MVSNPESFQISKIVFAAAGRRWDGVVWGRGAAFCWGAEEVEGQICCYQKRLHCGLLWDQRGKYFFLLILFYAPKETEFAAAAFLLAMLDEMLSLARRLQPCRAGWKLHGDGRGYNQALWVGHLRLQELAKHFNNTLNLPLHVTELFLSACHCNTSSCLCSWILSSEFWVAWSWLQWRFSFGSCHSPVSLADKSNKALKKNAILFLSWPWLIRTNRIV